MIIESDLGKKRVKAKGIKRRVIREANKCAALGFWCPSIKVFGRSGVIIARASGGLIHKEKPNEYPAYVITYNGNISHHHGSYPCRSIQVWSRS